MYIAMFICFDSSQALYIIYIPCYSFGAFWQYEKLDSDLSEWRAHTNTHMNTEPSAWWWVLIAAYRVCLMLVGGTVCTSSIALYSFFSPWDELTDRSEGVFGRKAVDHEGGGGGGGGGGWWILKCSVLLIGWQPWVVTWRMCSDQICIGVLILDCRLIYPSVKSTSADIVKVSERKSASFFFFVSRNILQIIFLTFGTVLD